MSARDGWVVKWYCGVFLSHVPNSLASVGRNGKVQSGLFFFQFCMVFILLPLTNDNK